MLCHQSHTTSSAESGVAPEAVAEAYHKFEQGGKVEPLKAAAMSNQGIQESMRLLLLVRAYQVGMHPVTGPLRHCSVPLLMLAYLCRSTDITLPS